MTAKKKMNKSERKIRSDVKKDMQKKERQKEIVVSKERKFHSGFDS